MSRGADTLVVVYPHPDLSRAIDSGDDDFGNGRDIAVVDTRYILGRNIDPYEPGNNK